MNRAKSPTVNVPALSALPASNSITPTPKVTALLFTVCSSSQNRAFLTSARCRTWLSVLRWATTGASASAILIACTALKSSPRKPVTASVASALVPVDSGGCVPRPAA